MRVPPGTVTALRRRAERARAVSPEGPEGWTKSPTDPMALLAVFPTLAMRDGWTLRAYQFRAGGNGNAVVWAMPADAPFPEPGECTSEPRGALGAPKPTSSAEDLREAIVGDGSPVSYLEASLFAREAAEFGALGHGCDWTDEAVLEADPWAGAFETWPSDFWPGEDESAWTWEEERPGAWAPDVERHGDRWSVRFHTFTPVGSCRILSYVDRYLSNDCCFTTECRALAVGPGGIVY